MPFDISVSEDKYYIKISLYGEVTSNDLDIIISRCDELIAETKSPVFLADCRKMKTLHSLVDLYNKVESYAKTKNVTSFKEAVLYTPGAESEEAVRFYETAALNRGYYVKMFTDADEGLKWLYSSSNF